MDGGETLGRVALVHRAYDTWNWYGVDRFAEFLADDVTLEDAPALPDARVTNGSAEVVRRLDEVAQTVGGGWVEIHGVEPVREAVLVTMTWKVDAPGDAEASLGEVFHLVEVDGNRISRIRVFLDRESAASA